MKRHTCLAGVLSGAAVIVMVGAPGGGEARAQSKGGARPGGVTKGNPATRINKQTHDEIERRLRIAVGKLSPHDKAQLGRALWGLRVVLRDRSPAPHVTLVPPTDPPAQATCRACGSVQAYPGDPCAGLRADLRKLSDDAVLKGLVSQALLAVKQTLVDLEFYGGVADLVADVVSTTSGLLTAGAGGALGKAATSALKELALDQVRAALLDAVAGTLPPPLDSAVSGQLDAALVDALISAADKAAAEANKKKNDKLGELQRCQASYGAALKTIDAANAAVVECRKASPAYCL